MSWDERNATIVTICTQSTIVEGEILTKMIACVVLSSEYVLKIANKLEWDLSFQRRSSTQCVLMFYKSRVDVHVLDVFSKALEQLQDLCLIKSVHWVPTPWLYVLLPSNSILRNYLVGELWTFKSGEYRTQQSTRRVYPLWLGGVRVMPIEHVAWVAGVKREGNALSIPPSSFPLFSCHAGNISYWLDSSNSTQSNGINHACGLLSSGFFAFKPSQVEKLQ